MRPVAQKPREPEATPIKQQAYASTATPCSPFGLLNDNFQQSTVLTPHVAPAPRLPNGGGVFDLSATSSQPYLSWDDAMKALDKPLPQMPEDTVAGSLSYQTPESMVTSPMNGLGQGSNGFNQPTYQTFSNGMSFDWDALLRFGDFTGKPAATGTLAPTEASSTARAFNEYGMRQFELTTGNQPPYICESSLQQSFSTAQQACLPSFGSKTSSSKACPHFEHPCTQCA